MSGHNDSAVAGATESGPASQEFASATNNENEPYVAIEIEHAKTGKSGAHADHC